MFFFLDFSVIVKLYYLIILLVAHKIEIVKGK